MKRIVLSLLTCSIGLSAFAQIDTSNNINPGYADKWVITPVKGMKGGLGRLNPNFPPGPERSVSIYTQSDNKFISSTPYNTKFYNLRPGNYRMMLNSVSVENVPIQEGYETRLKAGFLEVDDEGDWWLYDETKETLYTSGNKTGKFAFPIGKYQLMHRDIYTLVEIKDEPGIPANSSTIDSAKYIMVPLPNNPTPAEGRVALQFPLASQGAFFPVFITIVISTPPGGSTVKSCAHSEIDPCPPSYPLPEGYYLMRVGSHNSIGIQIKKGYETRLKVGYLKCLKKGLYIITDAENGHEYLSCDIQTTGGRYPAPIGNYKVKLRYVGEFDVKMTDGQITTLNPIDPAAGREPKWKITAITGTLEPPEHKFGRLNTNFLNMVVTPNNTVVKLWIPKPGGGEYPVDLKKLLSYDLLPRNYKFSLNNVIMQVPIEAGKETEIRIGYLDITANNIQWKIREEPSGKIIGLQGNQGRVLALPIGYYSIHIGPREYLIKIIEGETLAYPHPQ